MIITLLPGQIVQYNNILYKYISDPQAYNGCYFCIFHPILGSTTYCQCDKSKIIGTGKKSHDFSCRSTCYFRPLGEN